MGHSVEEMLNIEKNAKMTEPFSDAVTELKTLYKEKSPIASYYKILEGKKDALYIISKYLDGKETIDSIKSWYEYDKKYTAGTHDEFNLGRLEILEWAIHRLGL